MYHDFNDYVANLLARGDIELMMDQACDDLSRSHSSPPPRFVHHPFEAHFLCEFGGPELSSPGPPGSSPTEEAEGR